MSTRNITIVVLCGGNGTRLWPLSRKKLPKQFLTLVNDKTMFQNTILRFQTLNVNKYVIICNKEHQFIVEEQINTIPLNREYMIITEPMGRDTAAAVSTSAIIGEEEDITLIVPCDHVFDDKECCNVINSGINSYVDNAIVTFGIKPTYGEIGYGYIKIGKNNQTDTFVEKPDKQTADRYLSEGNYLWNAGLFMFKNKNMIRCFELYSPEILECCKNTINYSKQTGNTLTLNKELFEKCPSISIDYAIMEKITKDTDSTIKTYTLPYDYKWSDIGSFQALYDECEKDSELNVKKGDIITYNTKNCYIDTDKTVVATIGLDNIVIVNTRDALVVAKKDQTQDIKKIVNQLNKSQEDLKIVHAKAYRPWGWYINVEGNDHSGYKVKRIGVYPGKRLSLQSHNHRGEHWVITKGNARVQLDETFMDMGPNEHVFIPVKALHRMENIGDEMVEFVETQIGDYLGEDDIIRYQDDFGRV